MAALPKLVTPAKGKVSLTASSLGPKTKLEAVKVPVKQPATRAPKITKSPAIAGLPHRAAAAPRAPLGGTMTQKAAPGSFSAVQTVAKVLNAG